MGLQDFAGGVVLHITAGAVVIRLSAGVECCFATVALKNRLGIDDSLDGLPVHGVGGTLGLVMADIFRSPLLDLFSGNGVPGGVDIIGSQLGIQLTGIAAAFIYTAVLS